MPEQIIDVHTHPLFSDYVREMDSRETGGMTLPAWSAAQHLDVMDQHGIGTGILSLPSLTAALEGGQGRTVARQLNEELATLVARHSGRFGAFAVVPMDDMDAANTEMAYALDELKLDGVAAVPQHRGVYLGDKVYDPWFEEMDRRGVTLFVHPGAPEYFDPATSQFNVSVLEFMFETTRMITSMVMSGAKDRFGRVAIIAPHGGGTIPYLAHRITIISQMPWAYRDGPQQTMAQTAAALGSFYFDLTAATSPAQLDAIRRLVPAERLLMGFDYPLMPDATIAPALRALETYDGFSDQDRQLISHDNAFRLFPRLAG